MPPRRLISSLIFLCGKELPDHGFEFPDFFVLLFELVVLAGDDFLQLFDFLRGTKACRGFARPAEFEADAGINHVLTIAKVRCNAEHGVSVRAVECTDGCAVGIAVIAIAHGEVPFVFRIEVKRMKGSQGGSAGADFVNAASKLIDSDFCAIQLASVHCVSGSGRNFAIL